MQAFDTVLGEQLSSVIFVQDYLQLDFDGNRMTFYAWPVLRAEHRNVMFPDSDYRNFLCEFIAKKVQAVRYEEEVLFEVMFEDKSSLYLDLSHAEKEVLYYTDTNNSWSSM